MESMRAALLLAAVGLSSASGVTAQTIGVGLMVSKAGDQMETSRDVLSGAKAYLDFANAEGLLGARRNRLVTVDDGGEPAASVGAARQLLEDPSVSVLLGLVGDANVRAVALSAAFRNSGVALFGPVTGAPRGSLGEQVFPLRGDYASEARALARHFATVGVRRIAIAVAPGADTASIASALAQVLREQKVENVGTFAADAGSEAAMKRILAAKPQIVLAVGDSVAVALLVKAYRALDPGAFVAGLSSVNHRTLLELAGPAARGTILTQVVPSPNRTQVPLVREYQAVMRKFFDEPPSHASLQGYIAAKALVAALRAAPKAATRAEVLSALRSAPRLDLGGFDVEPLPRERVVDFVDVTLLRADGSLLQ